MSDKHVAITARRDRLPVRLMRRALSVGGYYAAQLRPPNVRETRPANGCTCKSRRRTRGASLRRATRAGGTEGRRDQHEREARRPAHVRGPPGGARPQALPGHH